MIQLLYVSRSLIDADQLAMDRLMIQARTNNAIDGITGLLWTDGDRFAQVIEGDERAIGELTGKLERDVRHADMRIVQRAVVEQRQFGSWSMARLSIDGEARPYEQKMVGQLAAMMSPLGDDFRSIIAGSRIAGS